MKYLQFDEGSLNYSAQHVRTIRHIPLEYLPAASIILGYVMKH